MRQVIRGIEPAKLNSSKISAKNISCIQKPKGRAAGYVYRSRSVLDALHDMYHEKCFLCEKYVKEKDGDVDHFIAYHANTPLLAYTWTNLNWCCKSCNTIKKRDEFRKKNKTGEDIKTILVDPSSPKPKPVRDMIRFNTEVEAYAIKNGSEKIPEVNQTVKLLNDPDVFLDRRAFKNAIVKFLVNVQQKNNWEEILRNSYFDHLSWTPQQHQKYKEAVKGAHDLWIGFLDAKSPYSAAMRDFLQDNFGIDHNDIKVLGEIHKTIVGSHIAYYI